MLHFDNIFVSSKFNRWLSVTQGFAICFPRPSSRTFCHRTPHNFKKRSGKDRDNVKTYGACPDGIKDNGWDNSRPKIHTWVHVHLPLKHFVVALSGSIFKINISLGTVFDLNNSSYSLYTGHFRSARMKSLLNLRCHVYIGRATEQNRRTHTNQGLGPCNLVRLMFPLCFSLQSEGTPHKTPLIYTSRCIPKTQKKTSSTKIKLQRSNTMKSSWLQFPPQNRSSYAWEHGAF